MGLIRSTRYILAVPSNVLMIISSALGYFFFSGLQTFALLFIRGHYNVGQATAELVLLGLVIGALVGTLVSGQADRRAASPRSDDGPRIDAGGVLSGGGVVLVPGIVGSSLVPAVWFDIGGAALFMAANPPLDAARLDIMAAGLWGRAESTRTFLRSLAQAIAPVTFGGLSSLIAGFVPAQAPVGTHPGGCLTRDRDGARAHLPGDAGDAVRAGLVFLISPDATIHGMWQPRPPRTRG